MEACDECNCLWGALENAVFSMERARTKLMSIGFSAVPTAKMMAEIDALEVLTETARRALRAHQAVSHGLAAHA